MVRHIFNFVNRLHPDVEFNRVVQQMFRNANSLQIVWVKATVKRHVCVRQQESWIVVFARHPIFDAILERSLVILVCERNQEPRHRRAHIWVYLCSSTVIDEAQPAIGHNDHVAAVRIAVEHAVNKEFMGVDIAQQP